MERTLYNAFYNKIGSVFLATILAKTAHMFLRIKYMLKKHGLRHEVVSMNREEAASRVQRKSPKPDISFQTESTPCNEAIDLSIIVPVYNYASVLESCLHSIVCQRTKYRYEMFFVDDGSTDGSSDILKKYENKEGVHILTQKNQGISAARNHAIGKASGRYFMFVDCDDILEPDAVELLLQEAYRGNCDIVEGAYYTFDGTTDKKRTYRQKRIRLEHNDFAKMMTYTGYPWAKVYKRELFRTVRFPLHSWFEDTLVKLILFRECERYSYIGETVYEYRKYEGNFTEKQIQSERGLEHYWLLEWMAELSEANKIGDKESLYLGLLYHLGALFLYRISGVEEETQKAAFVLGGELLKKYQSEKALRMKKPYFYQELERAYSEKDFEAWKLICQYM